MGTGSRRGPCGRGEMLAQVGILEGRANRLALGSAEERWAATAVLRDAAEVCIRAFDALDLASSEEAASFRRERASARVEACRLFLAAKDPVRATREWCRLPREAFSRAPTGHDPGAAASAAPAPAPAPALAPAPVDSIRLEYGQQAAAFDRAFRDVLGPDPARSLGEIWPDQLRVLAESYPGVPELWWALSRRTASAGEAELARTRALRLNPALIDSGVAEAAFRAIETGLLFRFRLDLSPELRSGRLTLELASRITAAFSAVLTSFGEAQSALPPELVTAAATGGLRPDVACAPRGLAGARHFTLEITAASLHPFALEELDRDLRSTLSRTDAGARVALLSLLQEHRIRLSASPLTPPDQPGLSLDETAREAALALAQAAALAHVDSREIPQADDVERVFRIVERAAKGKGDPTDISPRQISYYRRAAKILGFLDEDEALTPGGHVLARLDRAQQLHVGAVRFEASACGGAWIRWAGARTLLDVDPASAVDFLRSSAPGLGKDTCERRAQTLVAWHRALSAHHYATARAAEEPQDELTPAPRAKRAGARESKPT